MNVHIHYAGNEDIHRFLISSFSLCNFIDFLHAALPPNGNTRRASPEQQQDNRFFVVRCISTIYVFVIRRNSNVSSHLDCFLLRIPPGCLCLRACPAAVAAAVVAVAALKVCSSFSRPRALVPSSCCPEAQLTLLLLLLPLSQVLSMLYFFEILGCASTYSNAQRLEY